MPYVSEKQRKYFNANREKLEAEGVDVDEWNKSTKGKKLPKKAPKTAAVLFNVLVLNNRKHAAFYQGDEIAKAQAAADARAMRQIEEDRRRRATEAERARQIEAEAAAGAENTDLELEGMLRDMRGYDEALRTGRNPGRDAAWRANLGKQIDAKQAQANRNRQAAAASVSRPVASLPHETQAASPVAPRQLPSPEEQGAGLARQFGGQVTNFAKSVVNPQTLQSLRQFTQRFRSPSVAAKPPAAVKPLTGIN